MRTFPTTISDEFAKETSAISYYMELATSAGTTYKMAAFDVNWNGAAGAATLGFAFTEPITWDGSSTQTCKIAIPRYLTLISLNADIGTLALANTLRNGTIKLWLRGGLDAELAAALAAGKLQPWFEGRILAAFVSPDVVEVTCSTEWAVEGMTPVVRITPALCSLLPAPGATVAYGGGMLQLTSEGV